MEYLEDIASVYPDKAAFSDGTSSITFCDLLSISKKIGTSLIKLIPKSKNVLFIASRSIQYPACLLGILYSGKCFIPIAPDLPISRILELVEISDADTLIYDCHFEAIADSIPSIQKISVNDLLETQKNSKTLPSVKRISSEVSFIYYTSGSSGMPKGVALSQLSAIDFGSNLYRDFEYCTDDILGCQTPLYSLACMHDFLPCFMKGLTVYLIPTQFSTFPSSLIKFLSENRVTVLCAMPVVVGRLATTGGIDVNKPLSLKKVLFGGEALPTQKYVFWRQHCPDIKMYSCYGLTEVFTTVLYWQSNRQLAEEEKLPIGKPLSNVEVFLLDENNNISTTEGEICIKGVCLSTGYYNNTEATDNHFVINPVNKKIREWIFRTGDIAFYNEHNELVFKGRKDFQIKRFGYRVECEEIEIVATQEIGLPNIACVYNAKKKQLLLYYVGEVDPEDIRGKLVLNLPKYMIPDKIIKLEEMPISSNGKIDKKALSDGGAKDGKID